MSADRFQTKNTMPQIKETTLSANRIRWLGTVFMFLLALAFRGWDLSESGIQNDEQIWHERSARFVQSILGPYAPVDFQVPKVYWPRQHVDLKDSRFALASGYPFNIKMEAPHPGTPAGLLIGMSYLFLAKGSSNWSLDVGSIVEVTRYPGVVMGSLLVALVFLLGRHLVGSTGAFFAALFLAVEPVMVGYSRLARLDLSQAFWSTIAVLLYVVAIRTRRNALAVAAGIFAGLAAATNPYGLFIVPAMMAALLVYGGETIPGQDKNGRFQPWRRVSKREILLLGSWVGAFVIAYPNLWPNPGVGIYDIAKTMLTLPHILGEESTRMPVSHWFYAARSPQHILPWMMAFAALGTVAGLAKRSRSTLFLVLWIASIVLLLSLPAGRKSLKNFLIVVPAIALLAGAGLNELLGWLAPRAGRGPTSIRALAFVAVVGAGTYATWSWWPYPQVYTWPWVPDPQELALREIVGAGEGVKEAIEHIRREGPSKARIGMFTGQNNADYYYDPSLLGSPGHPDDLVKYDWLVVLPKLTFGVSGENPLVRWVRSREPTHIVRNHQIELVRLYRVGG